LVPPPRNCPRVVHQTRHRFRGGREGDHSSIQVERPTPSPLLSGRANFRRPRRKRLRHFCQQRDALVNNPIAMRLRDAAVTRGPTRRSIGHPDQVLATCPVLLLSTVLWASSTLRGGLTLFRTIDPLGPHLLAWALEADMSLQTKSEERNARRKRDSFAEGGP